MLPDPKQLNILQRIVAFLFEKLFKGFETLAVILILIFMFSTSLYIALNPILDQFNITEQTLRVSIGSLLLIIILAIYFRVFIPIYLKLLKQRAND